MKLTYKDSGVDIEEGNALVEAIKPIAKKTHRFGSMGGIGGFGALFDLKAIGFKDPILVSATDGVGSKLHIASNTNNHRTIGIDLVAMCVNDLIVQGAEPLFFLDYFATGKLFKEKAEQVISGIADGCQIAGCSLVGGETAEMPGMYLHGDYDLAGFAVGAVERDQLLPKNVKNNDTILGIASNGIHSNGYSLVRKAFEQTVLHWGSPAPFEKGVTISKAFLKPTRIYVKSILAAHKAGLINAAAHITGGGLLGNIPRVMPKGSKAIIDVLTWEVPEIFKWVAKVGQIETEEMVSVFNCGIGMVVITSKPDETKRVLEENGEKVYVIGHIERNSLNTSPEIQINLPDNWLHTV